MPLVQRLRNFLRKNRRRFSSRRRRLSTDTDKDEVPYFVPDEDFLKIALEEDDSASQKDENKPIPLPMFLVNDIVRDVLKFLPRKECEKIMFISRSWKDLIKASPDLPLRFLCIWIVRYSDTKSNYCMRDLVQGSPIKYYPEFYESQYDCAGIFQNCIIDRLPIEFRKSADADQVVINLRKVQETTRKKLNVVTCTVKIGDQNEAEVMKKFPEMADLIRSQEFRFEILYFSHVLDYLSYFESSAYIAQFNTHVAPVEIERIEVYKNQLISFLSGTIFAKRIGESFFAKLTLENADILLIFSKLIETFKKCLKPENFFVEIVFYLYLTIGRPIGKTKFFIQFFTASGMKKIPYESKSYTICEYERTDKWKLQAEFSGTREREVDISGMTFRVFSG